MKRRWELRWPGGARIAAAVAVVAIGAANAEDSGTREAARLSASTITSNMDARTDTYFVG